MTARAQIPFANCNSAETAASSADTVTASFQPPAPDAVAGYHSVSDGVDYGSLPSGESEPSAMLAYAPSEFTSQSASRPLRGGVDRNTSQSMGDAKTRHGRRAAVVDQEATAAFSFPESVRQLACRRVTAGDTGETHPLAFSPAGFPLPAIPFAKLQSRTRFDQYFDPEWFLAAIEDKSQPQLLQTLFQLAGDLK